MGEAHSRLKHRIHNFRIPLSPRGQRIAKAVYFSIPIVGGYFIMDWAQRRAEENLAHVRLTPDARAREQAAQLQETIAHIQRGEQPSARWWGTSVTGEETEAARSGSVGGVGGSVGGSDGSGKEAG